MPFTNPCVDGRNYKIVKNFSSHILFLRADNGATIGLISLGTDQSASVNLKNSIFWHSITFNDLVSELKIGIILQFLAEELSLFPL
jgi:hypothetical protein